MTVIRMVDPEARSEFRTGYSAYFFPGSVDRKAVEFINDRYFMCSARGRDKAGDGKVVAVPYMQLFGF